MICRTCNKNIIRIRGVRDDGTFFYMDDFDRRWNGRQCPVCHTKENTHRKREAEALEYLRGCGWVCRKPSVNEQVLP